MPTRWAARTSASGSSPTIATALAGHAPPEIVPQPGERLSKDDRRRLAEDRRPAAGRELEADDDRAGIERRTLRRQPPRVAVHGEERGPGTNQPERGVLGPEREVVAAIADDQRGDVPGRGLGLLAGHQMLAVELPEGVRRRDDVERPCPGSARRCRRPPRTTR